MAACRCLVARHRLRCCCCCCKVVRLVSGRFYIGCDECGGWFHGTCVGVSPTDVGRMDGYRCRVCRLKRDCDGVVVKEEQWTGLKKLISMLKVAVISCGLVSEEMIKSHLEMVFRSTELLSSNVLFVVHSFIILYGETAADQMSVTTSLFHLLFHS